MTPTERRDTLAAELPIVYTVTVNGGVHVADPYAIIDRLIPKVEGWLAVAWDEGYAAMGDESRPIGEPIVNPYRRDKT